MSDPNPPSDATAETELPADPPPRRASRYRRERIGVGVVFFALIGYVIINGAIQIHRDTFRSAAIASPWSRCSDGIEALYGRYAGRLGTSEAGRPRGPATGTALAALDEQMTALRPVCDGEGSAAHEAYTALTLWRHQAEDLSVLESRELLPDAQRALRYRSPGVAPASTVEPNLSRGNDR